MTLLKTLSLLTLFVILAHGHDLDEATCSAGCDGSCCTNFVMDNPLHEVIDFNTTVAPGVYYGIAVKLCADQPFAFGLWSQSPQQSDIQVLQFTAEYPGVNNGWHRIQRNGETYYALNFTRPWNVTSRMIFGVMGIGDVIPIPYSKDSSRSGIRAANYDSIQLGLLFNGQQPGVRQPSRSSVRIGRFNWKRTFKPFVYLCPAPGCTDEAQCVGCRGPRGFPGPPGPPGPTGPPGSGFGFACDTPDELDGKLNQVQSQTKEILDRISKVENDVNKIPKTQDTGLCPRNFISGRFGLGFCYNFWTRQSKSFGEAAFACAGVSGSHLVDIETAEEEAFLADTIVPMMKPDETNLTFFSSGLYSSRFADWVWYSDQVLIRKTLAFTNWGPNEQDGHEKKRTCLVIQVFRDKTTRWLSTPCTDKRGYICKAMKKCF